MVSNGAMVERESGEGVLAKGASRESHGVISATAEFAVDVQAETEQDELTARVERAVS